LQLGRGAENWGTGDDIIILLSNQSAPYDYLKVTSDYGRLRVAYLHGVLENYPNSYNRYFTAKGIEWTNKKTFLLSFSEAIIYSGKNRNIEFGYINPIGEHLEVEWNNRLTVTGEASANAAWQTSFDMLLKRKIRLSGNLIFDEFVFDKDIQKGKQHATAFSFRIAYSIILSNQRLITLKTSLLKVGTPTFRHFNGTNNFVNNNIPLGWQEGSDGYQFSLGFNYIENNKIIINLINKFIVLGEFSLHKTPYEPYTSGSYLKSNFPSGVIKQKQISYVKVIWKSHSLFSISSSLGLSCISKKSMQLFFGFGLNSNINLKKF